jgi:hypothetical protein
MDTTASAGAYDLLDGDFENYIKSLLRDTSLACMAVSESLGAEAAALLRGAGLRTATATRLADLLDESMLGDRCLLNLGLCDAARILLGEVGETALPAAARAQQLAEIFAAKFDTES